MSDENVIVDLQTLAWIRTLEDFDLIMFLSEVNDHGWDVAMRTKSIMEKAQRDAPEAFRGNKPEAIMPADTGKRRKEAGISDVLDNNLSWVDAAIGRLQPYLKKGQKISGEDIRSIVFGDIGPPSHPNAWGGLTHALVKAGIIRDTGLTTLAKLPSSHARRMPIWEVL